ncbi:MAG: hypothetical protein WBA40_18955 [Roseiarcus sp.]
MTFGRWLLGVGLSAVALTAAPGLAQAQEGSGCGGFRWPLEPERAALIRSDKPSLANGGPLVLNIAMTLELQPLVSAGLPKAPERAPKSAQAFAGHFALAAPAKPGVYKVTISSPGWIDVLDGEDYLHPKAFTGATGCEGARKSVKFDLPSRPLALQFSGVESDRISVIVSPDQ